MPGREYFSLRYTVPGFIVILTIVGMNYSPIVDLLRIEETSNVFGVVLSFLSLFAGSAIGFLVAQFWFGYFNWQRLDAKRIFRDFEGLMQKKLGWKPDAPERDKTRDSTLSAVMDYMLLYEKDENKWGFCQRKWDIYHILSCALVSLIFGAFLGLLLRVFLNFFFYGIFLFPSLESLNIEKPDLFLFVFALVCSGGFSALIWIMREGVFNEYKRMLRIFITRIGSKADFIKDLEATFPKYFRGANRVLAKLSKEIQYVFKVAKTAEESKKLIEAGFEYVVDFADVKVFRKRKY